MMMRITVAAAVVCLGLVGLSGATESNAAIKRYELNIPRQTLESALKDFAQQTGLQVGRFSDAGRGDAVVGPLNGSYSVEQALETLLAPTGLQFRPLNERAYIVLAPQALPETSEPEARPPTAEKTRHSESTEQSPAASPEARSEFAVEEIVVTAQKREQRLQDVPVPVSAIRADALVNTNQMRLQDYYTRIPGLSVTPADLLGAPILAIRGVTTGGFSNPTVGVTVDDVPYGSSTAIGTGYPAPDLDPSELERVEVLRGPQGTLYGASSLGGLLKFVTVDPSTEGFSGRVQAGLSGVRNGDEVGHSLRGSVNVPIAETWAVRASGFTRREPGYIDDPDRGIDGVNRTDADGGRLSLLWRPSNDMSLKLSAMNQHITAEGSSEIDVLPGLGDLQQRVLPGTGAYDRRIQAYSVNFAARLGGFDVTVLSGYNVSDFSNTFDYTPVFGDLTEIFFGVRGTPLENDIKTTKFTQEIRLATSLGARVDWLFGAFYTDEDSTVAQNLLVADQVTGARVDEWLVDVNPSTYREYAAFTDFTFHVTDRFDIQIGGRQSRNQQSYMQTFTGLYVPVFLQTASPFIADKVRTEDSSFTYLVTPQLKVSPDLMAYGRLASGYRPGGPNVNSQALGLPPSFAPDTTQNYEVGIKGSLFERALSFDASLYYIDWKEIQVSLTVPSGQQAYYANASRARSRGVELSAESILSRGLRLSGWLVYNDAELREGFPSASSAFGVAGERLPYGSRCSGNIALDQEIPLGGNWSASVGASLSYVGERVGVFKSIFSGSPQRQTFPSYTQADLHGGLKFSDWTASVFVNNLADKRAQLTGGLGTVNPSAFSYIQPRTIGLSLSRKF